ncbi:MAG: hypothetical protein ACK55I_00085, partial [bacterium]
ILRAMDSQQFKQRESQRQNGFRIIYDFSMGLIWFGAGLYFILGKYIGADWGIDSLTTTLFGVAALCYGVFRLYRGYAAKKNN